MAASPRVNREPFSGIALLISVFSTLLACVSLYLSYAKDVSVDLKSSTRDWQKGAIFSVLLNSGTPLTIDEIETRYKTNAAGFRDRFHLTDPNFSHEEIYSILLDLIGGQSIKLRDSKFFSVRTDDDALQDRRIAFDLLQFALEHEYQYSFDDFASQFANWYETKRANAMTKDKALSVLAVSMQSNIIGMSVKPGFRIACIGEVPPLYVASAFSIRGNAPAILPMPGQLPTCPPKN